MPGPVFVPAEQVLDGMVVRGKLGCAVNMSLELVAVLDLLLGERKHICLSPRLQKNESCINL